MFAAIKKLTSIKPLRNFSIYTFGTLLLGAVNFILLPVYSNYIKPNEYGILSLLIIAVSVMVVVIDGGLNTAFSIRFYREKNNDERAKNLYSVLIYNTALIALLFLLCFLRRDILSSILKADIPFEIQLKTCIIIALTIYANFFTNLLRLQEKALLFFVGSVIKSVVMGVLNILLLVVFKRDYSSYLDSMIIALLAVTIWGLIYYVRNFSLRAFDFRFGKLKRLIWLGLPLVPNGILGLLSSSTDKYILNIYLATATVGIYSMGFRIGQSIDSFVTTPLGQAFGPIAYRNYANDLESYKDLVRRVWHLFVILAFTFILFVVVFLDGIFFYFISKNYWSSYWVVLLVLSAYFISGSAVMLGGTIVVREKTYLSPLLTGLAGGMNVLFNILFIPRWGMMGAGFALLLSFIIIFICYYFITQHLIFIKHLWGEIAKSGIVFCISMAILLALSSLESFKLYKALLKILVFAGNLAVMLVLNKKNLKSLARIL